MADELSASAQRVQAALEGYGLTCQVVEMPAATRSAKEAAAEGEAREEANDGRDHHSHKRKRPRAPECPSEIAVP